MKIIKKNGTKEDYNSNKIKIAIRKSAQRVGYKLTEQQENVICDTVYNKLIPQKYITVDEIHNYVECALDKFAPEVARSYKDYRNYKKDFVYSTLKDIERQVQSTLVDIDRSNSNSNTRYNSTKRTEIAKTFAKEIYQKMFLPISVLQAIKDGYIYIHDLSDMILAQYNCCLTDYKKILDGGFTLEDIKYTEPKDIETAIGQVGDILQIISAQHFGGHTIPEVDKVLSTYYKLSIIKERLYLINIFKEMNIPLSTNQKDYIIQKSKNRAYNTMKQRLQGFEIKMNTVVSARGSYPFSTLTFGDVEDDFQAEVSKAILEVRMEGHGDKGHKKNLIFPKLVFLYNPDIHDNGKKYEWLFDLAIKCSSKCMYPDFLSPKLHKREGKWVSPMGCRAYLSDWRDENGELQFIGRFNIGAVSLNLPMIYMKSLEENKPFYDVLDYYLQMIRELHINRYEYLGKAKASSNPLMFCEGGALGGNLKLDDEIAPILKTATASFGITALNELSVLATGKTIKDDNKFAYDTVLYIKNKVNEFKKEDGWLYALYGTPAESLCGTQVQQFRKLYGIIPNVSDKDYFSNSFHCHVSEEITPFEKQDKELDIFKLVSGGHIQYVRVSNPNNTNGLKSLIKRGMEMGFYQGINFNACVCDDCGYTGVDWGETCPHCGSKNITEINRTCGYLGFSRKNGDRTFNDAKMCEIKDRKSM